MPPSRRSPHTTISAPPTPTLDDAADPCANACTKTSAAEPTSRLPLPYGYEATASKLASLGQPPQSPNRRGLRARVPCGAPGNVLGSEYLA
jgi:hypothetical protein